MIEETHLVKAIREKEEKFFVLKRDITRLKFRKRHFAPLPLSLSLSVSPSHSPAIKEGWRAKRRPKRTKAINYPAVDRRLLLALQTTFFFFLPEKVKKQMRWRRKARPANWPKQKAKKAKADDATWHKQRRLKKMSVIYIERYLRSEWLADECA